MPDIALLEWPAADLRRAIVEYARQRGTFRAVRRGSRLSHVVVKAWLWVRSREAYRYTVHLESELGPTGKPPGNPMSSRKKRWVHASGG